MIGIAINNIGKLCRKFIKQGKAKYLYIHGRYISHIIIKE